MNQNYDKDIIEHIQTKDIAKIRNIFSSYHPYDLSQTIIEMGRDDRNLLFSMLQGKDLGHILAYLEHQMVVSFFEDLKPRYIVNMIQELDIDDAVDLMKSLPESDQTAYLKLMDKGHREVIQSLIHYAEDTAGAMMTTEYIEIDVDDTVESAMKKLIKQSEEAETISTLYITNNKNVLVGTLSLREIIVARKGQRIQDIMNIRLITCTTMMDQEDVAEIFKNYDFTVLPVVDQHQKMLGIITIDDIVDVIEEEATEDYGLLAGVRDIEIDTETETVWKSAKKRLPWLLILSVLGFLTSTIISQFEATLEEIPSIALFLPMILGMAGNTGTQSLAVTIRGLINEEFSNQYEVRKHLFREVGTGILNGVVIGLILFFVTWLFLTINQTNNAFLITQTVSIAIVISLTVATFAGALIPIVIHALGIDPAIASGPFVTMVVDILGITVYFSVATLLLISLL